VHGGIPGAPPERSYGGVEASAPRWDSGASNNGAAWESGPAGGSGEIADAALHVRQDAAAREADEQIRRFSLLVHRARLSAHCPEVLGVVPRSIASKND